VRVQVQILQRKTATGLTVEQVFADKILVFLRQVLSFLMLPAACFLILLVTPRSRLSSPSNDRNRAQNAPRVPAHTRDERLARQLPHAPHEARAPNAAHEAHGAHAAHEAHELYNSLCSLCRRSDMHACAHKPGASPLGRLHGKQPRLGDHHVKTCMYVTCIGMCLTCIAIQDLYVCIMYHASGLEPVCLQSMCAHVSCIRSRAQQQRSLLHLHMYHPRYMAGDLYVCIVSAIHV
jgi:hypothetical protein